MIKGIYHSSAGMIAREYKLRTVASNLANANTSGFKADRRAFRTNVDNELVQSGPWGDPTRTKDLEEGLYTDWSGGPIEKTGVQTQFALNGEGFFEVLDKQADEVVYTRNGHFHMDENGFLVTSSGMNMLDDRGTPVQIVGNQFLVSEDGSIWQDGVKTGKIKLVEFEDTTKLEKKGDSIWFNIDPDQEPKTATDIEIMQGFLEKSNVVVVREMVDMIELNRAYEASSRVLTAQDQTLSKAVNQVGRVQ